MDIEYSGNKIPPDEAEKYMKMAHAYLKNITLGRIDACLEDESVQIALNVVADAMFDSSGRFGIASENNDGYSVSYSAEAAGGTAKSLYNLAALYLPPGLLCGRCLALW